MTLLDWLAAKIGYRKAAVENAPGFLLASAANEYFSIPDTVLASSHQELYQRLTWTQTAISAVATMAATQPYSVFSLNGEKEEQIANHPFEMLLRKPNPLMSRTEFLEATFAFQEITGNCYWWLNKPTPTSPPDEIWILPSDVIKPIPDGNLYLKGYEYKIEGMAVGPTLPPDSVVHFKRFHPNSNFLGLSAIEAYAIDAEGDLAMQRWNRNNFDKDNAKMDGALAFADPISNEDWRIIKEDIRRRHGGTNRELMMLRNAGKGGVQWIPMSFSRRDMEFLAGRNFTKEEIFAMHAPGLASVLAINATEANSQAGRATLMEFAIWPKLVKVAEKIANDILPYYGEKLTGQFDDPRSTDRVLELQEIDTYAKFHTINEVREKYYQAEWLKDHRGELLVIELTKSDPILSPEPDVPTEVEPKLIEMKPEAPHMDAERIESLEMKLAKIIDLITEVKAPVMPAPVAPTIVEPEPTIEPVENSESKARSDEMKAFRRWLKRHPDTSPLEFETIHLEDDELWQMVKAARDLPGNDGRLWHRARIENAAAERIEAAFRKIQRVILPVGTTAETLTVEIALERYRASESILRDALLTMYKDAAALGVRTAREQVEYLLGTKALKAKITVTNWDMVNQTVLDWVLGSSEFGSSYLAEALTGLSETTEGTLRTEIAEWIQNGLPLSNLIEELQRTVFSHNRAQLIAVTEVTHAYAEANRRSWQASGIITKMRWNTSEDERVCTVCGGLNERVVDVDSEFQWEDRRFIPPAHARCRCWLTPHIEEEAS